MPRARKTLVCTADTPYYHCVSRCVRRAFLCGEDIVTGNNYEHRRQWVEDRLHLLAEVFSIDVCAYAVMSNHTHVVLHIHEPQAQHWSVEEVLNRWHRLYKGTLLTRQYTNPAQRPAMPAVLIKTVQDIADIWRQRLCSISWFMRALNEPIARQANQEDNCTGRFWEGRFKSQALLDETALAACMAYVDLNPIRARMAKTPETSDHTSIQYRIHAAKAGKVPKRLMPFAGYPRKKMPHGIPLKLTDYLSLVDLTGRHMAKNKKGCIEDAELPILTRLNINAAQWEELTHHFERCFYQAAGSEEHLIRYQQNNGLQRIRGRTNARRLLSSG
ncbi:MAG: transposase [Aestuariibacter sp.]